MQLERRGEEWYAVFRPVTPSERAARLAFAQEAMKRFWEHGQVVIEQTPGASRVVGRVETPAGAGNRVPQVSWGGPRGGDSRSATLAGIAESESGCSSPDCG